MSHIPTEADWHSEPLCLDGECAYRNFFGKSREAAVLLFIENSLYYQEDLMFMPARCLSFYIDSYIDYLLSDASQYDCGGACCFIGLFELIVQHRSADLAVFAPATIERICQTLRHLRDHQAWYDDDHICDDFSERAVVVLQRL